MVPPKWAKKWTWKRTWKRTWKWPNCIYDYQQVTQKREPAREPACEPARDLIGENFTTLFLEPVVIVRDKWLHLPQEFETMEIYMNTIFPLIGATLMVSAAGFAYELVSRKYKQLKELSQSGESIFMWVSKGWPILAALLNINFGILLFLTAIIFALRLYDMAVIPPVWL